MKVGGLEVSVFVGDLADAPAEVLCTSTNPRLSLSGGTGLDLLSHAGWSVRREAQALVEREAARTGRPELPVGTVHRTSAGLLPRACVLHCVASDALHRSSEEAIRSCVQGALAATQEAGCASVAMPVFGTGHASFPFERAVAVMADALASTPTSVRRLVIVTLLEDRAAAARRVLADRG